MDTIKVWTTKTSYYFLTISKAVFTFIISWIYQAVIRWIYGEGLTNCCMVVLFYILFMKSRELRNN